MKKTILSILISVLLITSFSACRDGDAETAGTTVSENTTAESTAEISSAPQTIEKTLDGVTLKVYIENPKVKSGGEVFIGETPVELDQVAEKLKAIAKNGYDEPIYIRGDRGVAYGVVMRVMGRIKAGGFNKLSFVTDEEKGG